MIFQAYFKSCSMLASISVLIFMFNKFKHELSWSKHEFFAQESTQSWYRNYHIYIYILLKHEIRQKLDFKI